MSITPTLCAMLQDPLLRARYCVISTARSTLSQREIERNRDNQALRELSEFYHASVSLNVGSGLLKNGNAILLSAFAAIAENGALEIIASAATHGLLPLLQQSREAVRAQVLIGCDVFRETFQADRRFWLPECAYAPGLEDILQEANLRWFILDTHGVMFGEPPPRRAIFAPYFTAAGPAVFARDGESSRQVWSAEEGYPGDPAYRDFYRDIGYDLPPEYLWPGSRTSHSAISPD